MYAEFEQNDSMILFQSKFIKHFYYVNSPLFWYILNLL